MADLVLGRQGITRDEVEVWTRDLEERGQEGTYFFSLNRYCSVLLQEASRY